MDIVLYPDPRLRAKNKAVDSFDDALANTAAEYIEDRLGVRIAGREAKAFHAFIGAQPDQDFVRRRYDKMADPVRAVRLWPPQNENIHFRDLHCHGTPFPHLRKIAVAFLATYLSRANRRPAALAAAEDFPHQNRKEYNEIARHPQREPQAVYAPGSTPRTDAELEETPCARYSAAQHTTTKNTREETWTPGSYS